MTQASAAETTRGTRRVELGTVVSNKGDKTITVHVSYTTPHKQYGKIIRRRTKLYAHDEKNEARPGDVVEVAECRRYSKLKTWRLVRVVRKAPSE
ncbi:MAG: 30S ribosomal protein S17 [Phycisphaerae bacterium]|nr:30S ribosomal protein S17 [Phycisphaerae bacterium]